MINSVIADNVSATHILRLTITYTPCTGACPMNLIFIDTGASLNALPAGDYTAYRFKVNSLIAPPSVPPDDSVTLTVYATADVRGPERTVTTAHVNERASDYVYDCAGRQVRASALSGARPGVYFTTTGNARGFGRLTNASTVDAQ